MVPETTSEVGKVIEEIWAESEIVVLGERFGKEVVMSLRRVSAGERVREAMICTVGR